MRPATAAAMLLLAALAGCADEPAVTTPCGPDCAPPMAGVRGVVSDPDGTPLQARVAVDGAAAKVGDGGAYEATVGVDRAVTVRASAPGFLDHEAQVDVGTAVAWHNITLAWRPGLVVVPWNATITCDAIIDVGHDHGSGGPDEDEHLDCDPDAPYPELRVDVPENTTGLVAEVAWTPEQPQAQHLTAVLRDAEGMLLGWSEGAAPLRIQLPVAAVGPLSGATVALRVSAGAGEEDITASVAYQQDFTAALSLFIRQEAPATYTAL